ncbi:hypothetical protein KOI35_05740 [Actinoplanes bogorensis]|uniref:SAF domain-containing protein n=2 Tax=Paractinoplanes bogorensis TaxID=1610840 RepID=A0ABS5YHQ7_9ACTN|nr:hypothetical protein [Actinoplanes bogorensis]
MGRSGSSRLGDALPKAQGSSRGDGRLDPVRWRRPARGTLLRLAVVAILLGTAALVSWSPPPSCESPTYTVPAANSPSASAPATNQVVPPGNVGVPVRLADPAALALVEAGNRVDLLRLEGGSSTQVADAALVLQVSGSDDPTSGGLLLALTPDEAERAVAGPGQSFAVLIRPS